MLQGDTEHADQSKADDTPYGVQATGNDGATNAMKPEEAQTQVDAEKKSKEHDPNDAQTGEEEQKDEEEARGEQDGQDAALGGAEQTGWDRGGRPEQSQQAEQENAEQQQQERQRRPEANPYKSLGDAEKEWQQRLDMLPREEKEQGDDEAMDENRVDELDNRQADAHEFVGEGEQADKQALGDIEDGQEERPPALDDQDAEDGDEAMADADGAEQDGEDPAAAMDVDEERPGAEDEKQQQLSVQDAAKPRMPRDMDAYRVSNDEAEKDAEAEKDWYDQGKDAEAKEKSGDAETEAKGDGEQQVRTISTGLDGREETMDTDEPEDADGDAEPDAVRKLREELATLTPDELVRGTQLWQDLVRRTTALTNQLSEQLRLILEPTLASKLQGDYRTGKRINMRKVIPYIASHFKKDKIWLRRTKPAKRQYQILVAVDDSLSMIKMQDKAGLMACEALTVLLKALSHLESGDLAVLRFGDGVDTLHGFGTPFTDQTGASIISRLQFRQDDSDIVQLLEHVVSTFIEAKIGGPVNVRHMQMAFILSDARNIASAGVKRQLREAAERGQLVVLVIIDNEENSIMDTMKATRVNGKLKMGKLMDDFPFTYYILLRDVHSMPHMMAGALRQWFELLSSD